jgi:putative toxin-antitoxin system antitoxin component (TIGR02293 family)
MGAILQPGDGYMSAEADAIIDLLGGPRKLGASGRASERSQDLLHEQALTGFRAAALRAFHERLPVARGILAKLLNTSEKTLERRLAGSGRLTTAESNALVRTARVVTAARQLFDTDQAVRTWLSREQPGLGGRVPLDLMQTETGAAAVETLLERLYHGVLP